MPPETENTSNLLTFVVKSRDDFERIKDAIHDKRREASLVLKLDLTHLTGRSFIQFARLAKEFLVISHGQKREVTIICTSEQKNLEINVFESGVKWENSNN